MDIFVKMLEVGMTSVIFSLVSPIVEAFLTHRVTLSHPVSVTKIDNLQSADFQNITKVYPSVAGWVL